MSEYVLKIKKGAPYISGRKRSKDVPLRRPGGRIAVFPSKASAIRAKKHAVNMLTKRTKKLTKKKMSYAQKKRYVSRAVLIKKI